MNFACHLLFAILFLAGCHPSPPVPAKTNLQKSLSASSASSAVKPSAAVPPPPTTTIRDFNFRFPSDASNYVWTLWWTPDLAHRAWAIVPFNTPPTNHQLITNLNPIYFYRWRGNL